ncbi:MAG: NAD(P)-dependent oxidoreductase [Bacteroidales bacterium]
MIKEELHKIKEKLLASDKKKLLSISTTANVNNPDFVVGSLRETETTLAGNIILRSANYIEEIISFFDGLVDYFLLDPEVKNELHDLEQHAKKWIKKSKYLVYKPNDFTVAALDMLIAVKSGSLAGKKIAILGSGNIGAKTALVLCERGAHVYLYDKDAEKSEKVAIGFNLVAKSIQKIIPVSTMEEIKEIDIVIGCTPGIKAITKEIVIKTKNYLVDAGNGCFTGEAIACAKETNKPIYVLSSFPGYYGMIENWIKTMAMNERKKIKKVSSLVSLISPGILGTRGDILVDNPENPTKIIGICDGTGDVLYGTEAVDEMEKILSDIDDPALKKKLRSLYF